KLAVATVSLAIGSVVAVPAIVDSGQVAHAEEITEANRAKYEVNYDNVSGTPGYTFPYRYSYGVMPGGSLGNGERKGWVRYNKDDVVKPLQPGERVDYTPPKPIKYLTEDYVNKGVWTFQGYNKDIAIAGTDDLTFIATWTFTPTKNPVKTKVFNPHNLSQDEKDQVAQAVKDANSDFPEELRVTVGDNGTAQIYYTDSAGPNSGLTSVVLYPKDTIVEKEISAVPAVDKVDSDDHKVTGTGVPGSEIMVTLPYNRTVLRTSVKPDGKWEVDMPLGASIGSIITVSQGEIDKKFSSDVRITVVATIADEIIPNTPELTIVEDSEQLTKEEKDKVKKEVEKANPGFPAGTTVTVSDNGDLTIVYPDESIDRMLGDYTVVKRKTSAEPTVETIDSDDVKIIGAGEEGAKIEVTLPDGTKKRTTVKQDRVWEVELDNPLATDSVVKITQEETGKKVSSEIQTTVVAAIEDPELTTVEDSDHLTEEEKGKVKDAVKAANPTATKVEVEANGTATVTFPDGTTGTLIPYKTVKEADTAVASRPTPTPVKNPAALTKDEKEKVKKAVRAVNPGNTGIRIGADGTATVVFIDGTTATLTPDKTVKAADANGIKDPAVPTPVKDLTTLTEDEKGEVKDAVKAANLTATKVEVEADGTATVTFPDGTTATLTPDKTVKAADANGIKNPAQPTQPSQP
ncbi:Ig-like domain-containing protein, partial [Gemella sp. 27098_8_92]|uniref:Ig-like domain-containing protein n=1 Tax=Gemella sp. 27098_8_92 TaxID=3003687 RepID=UPI00352D6139